ncbi:hypothetical protein [Fibrobacter sp.]|uniref:hypothetical protein n=1 Tax=Fibrobacter sp. TaxID=35828 RepID=UPI00386BB894
MSVVCFLRLSVFRYLDRLKELSPALKTEKFEGLLPFAELARFNKKELKRYRYLKLDRFDEMYDAVIAENFLKGKTEGKSEGKTEGHADAISVMQAMGLPPEQIAEAKARLDALKSKE